MQTIDLRITLSDQVAREARDAGLLSAPGVAKLVEEAVRREAGRQLLDAMKRLRDAALPSITEGEIAEEIRAYRARRQSA